MDCVSFSPSALPVLEDLSFDAYQFDLSALWGHPTIRALSLLSAMKLTSNQASAIRSLPSLRRFSMRSDMSEASMRALTQEDATPSHLIHLEEFDLSRGGESWLTPFLVQFQSLTNFSPKWFYSHHVSLLHSLPCLTRIRSNLITSSFDSLDKLISIFDGSVPLRSLWIRMEEDDVDGMLPVTPTILLLCLHSPYLQHSLKDLTLQCEGISGTQLARMLRYFTNLTRFKLDNRNYNPPYTSGVVEEHLSRATSENNPETSVISSKSIDRENPFSTLTDLTLEDMFFSELDVGAVFDVLPQLTTLRLGHMYSLHTVFGLLSGAPFVRTLRTLHVECRFLDVTHVQQDGPASLRKMYRLAEFSIPPGYVSCSSDDGPSARSAWVRTNCIGAVVHWGAEKDAEDIRMDRIYMTDCEHLERARKIRRAYHEGANPSP